MLLWMINKLHKCVSYSSWHLFSCCVWQTSQPYISSLQPPSCLETVGPTIYWIYGKQLQKMPTCFGTAIVVLGENGSFFYIYYAVVVVLDTLMLAYWQDHLGEEGLEGALLPPQKTLHLGAVVISSVKLFSHHMSAQLYTQGAGTQQLTQATL